MMRERGIRRRGLTLIELLVVVAILGMLASLTLAFLPSLNESNRAARGGSMLQQWLSIAKQQALRDQAPRGVRLLLVKDPATGLPVNPPQVRELQYIEQPEDFTDGSIMPDLTDANRLTVLFKPPVDLHQGSSSAEEWLVQVGDYLEVLGGGQVHRITEVGADYIKLASRLAFDFTETANFRILRAPRVSGDELLTLPESVAIDLQTNNPPSHPTYPGFGGSIPPLNADGGSIDILFAPSGAVISPNNPPDDFIALWVRDMEDPNGYDPFRGEPTIIAVYVRSGLAAAHPPKPLPGDVYEFARDGRSSQ